jgi:hypothetical protein
MQRPCAKVSQDDAAVSLVWAGNPDELLHQICVRKPVESIATNSQTLEPPRNRHDLCHTGHVVMKGRVEARHLGQRGSVLPEGLDQLDLARQVVRVVRAQPAQISDQLCRHALGLMVATAAVDDSVPDQRDGREPARALEPIDQDARGRPLVRGIHRAVFIATTLGLGRDQSRVRLTDPLDPT